MKDTPPKPAPADLEIKDAQLIFHRVWKSLEEDFGRERLHFPKELILLGGAPGSGKGTNTAFIRKVRGIASQPVVISQLLDPSYHDSALLDGFPRTKVQVECLKMFYDQMVLLRREFSNTPQAHHFKQPTFHIMVLFVDEAESVARQLKRGDEAKAHNAEVKQSGVGELQEERATDFDPELARNRYRTFKEQTYDALVSLKQIFHYHFINAQASIEMVQENIIRELEYQSTLELDPRTFDPLRHIPLADEVVLYARQELVNRLDGYQVEYPDQFAAVVEFIQSKMMPTIKRYAVSGKTRISTEDQLFNDPRALAMLIDIFSERGFRAMVDVQREKTPERVDLSTGEIFTSQKPVYRMSVFFEGSKIRRG